MTTTTNTGTFDHIWWLASRASGIVAILLLTFTVIVGLMMGGKMVQRLTGKPGKGALAIRSLLQSHEQASIAALIAIAVHGLTLLGDAFLHPALSQIAVPFTIAYKPFYTGLGIIGGYIAVLLGLSFYVRARIGMATWKKLHRWTIAAYALSVVHALGAGTDAASSWFEIPLLGSAALVAVLFVIRASTGARSPAKAQQPVVRRPAAAGAQAQMAATPMPAPPPARQTIPPGTGETALRHPVQTAGYR